MATLTAPPDALAPEWAGHAIGISNVATRTRAPARRDATGDRDRLRVHAQRALEGKHVFIEDAVFHGVRVRFFTTSHHLADFWRDYAYTPAEWRELTGKPLPASHEISIYAVGRVPEIEEGVYEFPGEIFLFNTSWFGDVRTVARQAVWRALEPRGVSVVLASSAAGWIFVGPGKSGAALSLAERGAALLGDDAVCVGPEGAFRLEKGMYLRTSLVQAFPRLAAPMLRSKFENVPDAPEGSVEALEKAVLATKDVPAGPLRKLLTRLTVYEGSRVMLLPSKLYGKSRVTRPLEPVRVRAVARLRLDPKDERILSPSAPEKGPLADFPWFDVNAALGRPEAATRLAQALESKP